MLRVGLTGGIASGKSQVLARLAAAGFHTLDLDGIAHQVMAPGGTAHLAVVSAFGPGILDEDGAIDRRKLGAIAFADEAARARLNAIVHPLVWAEEERRIAGWSDDPGAVVITDAALLVETGAHLRFDRLVVVHCSAEEQLRRLMARDGIDEAAARVRIDSQMPADEKRRFAHLELDTSGAIADTLRAADGLAGQLRAVAFARGPAVPVPLARALGGLVHGPQDGPRGLAPARLLRELVEARGIHLPRLARLLDPPGEGPWYRVARRGEGGPSPARLVVPLVLWSLARSSPDPPYLLGAVSSVARLTHRDASSIAEACLHARALLEVGVDGRIAEDLPDRARRWTDEAARWGGAFPTLSGVFGAAARHREDPSAARAAAADQGRGELAGALVGLAIGVRPDAVSAELREIVGRLAGE